MAEIDYYQILGVDQKADPKQLKNAFRELAFQYHPDRNADNLEAAEKMKQINEAYAVLSDPKKRQAYDSLKSKFGDSAYGKFRNGYSDRDIFSGSDINHIFDEMAKAFGFRGVDEVFHDVYGKGYKRFEFKQPGFFAAGFVFSNLFANKKTDSPKSVFLNLAEKAARFAIGKLASMNLPGHGNDLTDHIRLTPSQAAQGGPYAYYQKKNSKKLVINIPKNIREGQRIRLVGMGESGSPGDPPGDLYLKVLFWKPWSQRLQEFTNRLIG
ncbi:MAG: J domain-containing protein [Desulfobacteraceae bacterium]|nr:MAG: J domain-containing protein [Desulfobacteraceae bacterium]